MEKLKISFTLHSPLVTNGGYMTLDALLAALIFEQSGDLEKAHADIPLKNTNGLWHASAAIIEKIDTEKKGFVANLHAGHDLDLDLVLKNKNGNVHKAIGLTRRRDYGAVFNSYRMFTATEITWYANGDREQIQLLLSEVEFIGKRRASGFGQVSNLIIEESDIDGVSGLFGEPLRPVPVDMFNGDKSSLRADAAWRPAYWHPLNRTVCYVPAQ
jgi:hypothetical protein